MDDGFDALSRYELVELGGGAIEADADDGDIRVL